MFSQKQADVLINATARWNLLTGAVSSGKTYVSYWLLLKRCRTLPNGPGLLVGKTERTLRRNVLDPMRELFGADIVSNVDGAGQVTIAGRRFYVAGANDDRAVTKIQGLTLVYAYGDEFATWPESFLGMLRSRLRLPGACFDGTCNPEGPYHPVKREFLDKEDGRWIRVWRFALDDNPFLDPAYVEAIKSEYTGLWYRRLILGEWCAAEGAIYDALDADRHVRQLPPDEPPIEYYAGLDYGTGSVTTCWLIARTDNRLHCVARWRHDVSQSGRQLTDVEVADALNGWLDGLGVTPRWIFVPQDAASLREHMIRTRHVHQRLQNVVQADQSPGSVLAGIRCVAALLAAGRLTFEPGIPLDEWTGYSWDPQAQQRGEDRPLKRHDHDPDAARYAIYGTRHIWRPLIGTPI